MRQRRIANFGRAPLTVGLGLITYQTNRSRSDMNGLQLAVTYDDPIYIENSMESADYPPHQLLQFHKCCEIIKETCKIPVLQS